MTSPTSDASRVASLLAIYADHPLPDGDAVLVLDDLVCVEAEQLTEAWPRGAREGLVSAVRQNARRVLLAVARPGAELLPGDYQVWRDLHHDLRGTGIDLLPVRGLPAA